MNKQLEKAIKKLELDPSKMNLLAFNKEQFSAEDIRDLQGILPDSTICVFVIGDVRTAVEVFALSTPIEELSKKSLRERFGKRDS